MIKTLIIEDNHILEAEFFSKRFSLSPTSINTLVDNPATFYKDYVLKKRSWKYAKHLLEGILIHFLVLEDSKRFASEFVLAPEGLPSENNIEIIDKVFELYLEQENKDLILSDFRDEILDFLVQKNLHQHLKDTDSGLGDDKRLAKIADTKGLSYFTFLKNKGRKMIIDAGVLDTASRRAEIVKRHVETRFLLGLDMQIDPLRSVVYNEKKLSMPLPNFPFDLKGILDNFKVERAKKKITINDFKTTGGSLTDFSESVKKWRYSLQPAVYERLVRYFLRDYIDDTWEVEFNFIVFDRSNSLYIFPVSPQTMWKWQEELDTYLEECKYHFESRDFSLPYAFATKKVRL